MNLFSRIAHNLRRLRKNQDGAIVTELALMLPIFLILLSGIVEVGFFLLLNLKIQHSVVAVADLTTRDEKITEETITDIFLAVPQIMTPYYDPLQSRVYISAVSRAPDEGARIFWQRTNGALANSSSEVGVPGDSPNLPANIAVDVGETVLVTEYHFAYEPLIFDILDPQTIVRTAYFRPRLGSLQSVE